MYQSFSFLSSTRADNKHSKTNTNVARLLKMQQMLKVERLDRKKIKINQKHITVVYNNLLSINYLTKLANITHPGSAALS